MNKVKNCYRLKDTKAHQCATSQNQLYQKIIMTDFANNFSTVKQYLIRKGQSLTTKKWKKIAISENH